LGEVILVANAEGGGSAGVDGGGHVVVAIAEEDFSTVESGCFGEGVKHL
jgi:hypothetical protein